jgi:ubiquinol-cytochrome c reductase cytochrome c subunit
VSWITARRRRPAAGYAVLLLALVLVGVAYAALAGHRGASAAAIPPGATKQQVAEGRSLFETTCASCHGMNAQGSARGPSLIGVGAAAVDFQISTGRMPANEIGAQMAEKRPTLTRSQTLAIASFIASLGGGPPVPSAAQVSVAGSSAALGEQLFASNCAACHNFAGAGGALTYGKYGPSLTKATPTQIYEAMLTGPESMPVFSDRTVTPDQKRAIINFITQTRSEPNPGGFSLGRVGPVTEGIVGWVAGMGLLALLAMWITARQREHEQ